MSYQNFRRIVPPRSTFTDLLFNILDNANVGLMLRFDKASLWVYSWVYFCLNRLSLKIKVFYFESSSWFTAKLNVVYWDVPYPSFPPTHSLPHSQHPSRVALLLHLMNLQGHVIVAQSPQVTLGFALGVARCRELDKSIMTGIYHNTVQSISRVLKTLCVCPLITILPLSPANHCSFYRLHSFTFSRMLRTWTHAVCTPSRLASFT